jgi:hypothetical protein
MAKDDSANRRSDLMSVLEKKAAEGIQDELTSQAGLIFRGAPATDAKGKPVKSVSDLQKFLEGRMKK